MAKKLIKQSAKTSAPLSELLEDFLREKEARGLSEPSLKSYEGSFKKFNSYLGEKDTAADISEEVVQDWILNMRDSDIKAASLNHYLNDMRVFLYWCMDKNYIDYFKIHLISAQEEVKETYTEEELEALLVKPKRYDGFCAWRSWAIVNWLYATGNRAATICNIRLEDVDFQRDEIILSHTKNKRAQILPLSPALKTALKEYIRMWRSEAAPEEFLFCNIQSEQMTYNALRQSIEQYNRERGVNKTSVHAFRHTFARDYILNTGDLVRLQKLLGHSTLEMTRRYANMFDKDLKESYAETNPLDRMKHAKSRRQLVKKNTNI